MHPDDRPGLVFVLNGLAMGGAEAQLLAILEADPDALARVRTSVLTLTSAAHAPFLERLAALHVPVTTIDRGSLPFPLFLGRLVAYFRRERPAVVHAFLAGTASTWGRAAALLAGVPSLVLSDLSLAPTVTPMHQRFDPWLHRRTARFLPNALAIARRLEQEGAPPERIRLLRNGVDLDRFDPSRWPRARTAGQRARWGASEDAVVVGFLGRLAAVKRPELALEAVLAIPEDRRPDRLWFAGDGPLRPLLEDRIAADAWARDHVRLLGVIDDVPAFLATIDLLVLSSDTEGFPNAVLEAGAMGRPVVATRVSDLPALLADEDMVPVGDRDALASKIATYVASGPAGRAERASALHARVRTEFGLTDAARAFWAAQDDLLEDALRPDVALLLPSLAGGGAERVVLDLAGAFVERGVSTDLVLATRHDGTRWTSSDVPTGVRTHELGAVRTATALLALIRYLRRRRPRALLSTLEQTNALALWAARVAPGVRLVVREANRSDVDGDADGRGLRERILRWALRVGLPRADAIVAVSRGVAEALVEHFGALPERVTVLENPAITKRLLDRAAEPCTHPWFVDGAPPVVVGLARLAPQKRLDDLIRAFALARARTPCRLLVMGEGPERAALETLVRDLGVTTDVDLPGWVDDPFPCLARAGCFVLSSGWEGMPNALVQARALGVPVVSTDCPSGPAEVLDGGRQGRLVAVGDVPALADAIVGALGDRHASPPVAWRSRFALDAVADRYLAVLRGDDHRPLRILLATTSLQRGGAENQVAALARGLRGRGHTVRVVSMRDPEAHAGELSALGVEVVSLAMRRGRPDPRGLLRLAREVRRFRPDVVHAHMVHANLLARLARPLAWAPVLISSAHNVNEGARWRELAYRLTDPLTDLTTNVCESGVERFVRVGAVPEGRIVRMPNGIDVDAWAPDGAERDRSRAALGVGDAFVWLFVGRMEAQKDVASLLRAIENVPPADRSTLPSRLLLVGEGPDRPALESFANERQRVDGRVVFLGMRADVPSLMQAADAFVLSSHWEGLPIVLLEAASAGLPIVATDVGGVREIVHPPATGRLVERGSPAALAAAMRDVEALDSSGREAMGRAARADVRNRFGLAAVLDAWEVRYRTALPRAHVFGGAS